MVSGRDKWILVDDLTTSALQTLRPDHPPGIIVETSARNFQTWIQIARPVPVATRTKIARTLMQIYGADPGGVGGASSASSEGLYPELRLRARLG